MSIFKPIAESNNFIVLEKYDKHVLEDPVNAYQSEADLEHEFIRDLISQGYENPVNLTSYEALLANVRVQLEQLNGVRFNEGEWRRFVEE